MPVTARSNVEVVYTFSEISTPTRPAHTGIYRMNLDPQASTFSIYLLHFLSVFSDYYYECQLEFKYPQTHRCSSKPFFVLLQLCPPPPPPDGPEPHYALRALRYITRCIIVQSCLKRSRGVVRDNPDVLLIKASKQSGRFR